MSYRFLQFTTVYDAAQQRLLSGRSPNDLSYQTLYDYITGFRFAWSDYYGRYLRDLGNEAETIFANVEPLQKAWARAHGVKSNGDWLRKIAVAQARQFQPDVIFIEDLYVFDADFRRQLRAACRGRVLMAGYQAAPTADFESFRDMDLLLTCVPHFAARLAQSGARVGVLRHAFEPETLEAVGPVPERDLEFTFTGHLVLENGYHQQRRVIIEKLLERTPLELWIRVSEPNTGATRLAAGLTRRTGRVLQGLRAPAQLQERFQQLGQKLPPPNSYLRALERRFPGRSHSPVFGLDNFRVLARSRVTFNNHIDVAEGHAGNMRLFEATGMGACLLTDWKQDLHEIFEPDTEIVAYRTADECVEKIEYLLSHEQARESIAAAGQRRTLRDHTFAGRVAQFDEIIRTLLAKAQPSTVAYSQPR